MKKSVLFLSIIIACGLTMVTIYNTMVDAKSWGADIPTSIQTARDYYKFVDPRNFFAIIGPINQVLILLTIIIFWKESASLRVYFAISFFLYAIILIMTFLYFIPRDLILFTWPIDHNIGQIKTAHTQWTQMNWVRTLLGLVGVLFSFKGLDSYYKTLGAKKQE